MNWNRCFDNNCTTEIYKTFTGNLTSIVYVNIPYKPRIINKCKPSWMTHFLQKTIADRETQTKTIYCSQPRISIATLISMGCIPSPFGLGIGFMHVGNLSWASGLRMNPSLPPPTYKSSHNYQLMQHLPYFPVYISF